MESIEPISSTLPETNSSLHLKMDGWNGLFSGAVLILGSVFVMKMDGWNTIISFWVKRPIFRCVCC